MEGDGNNPYIVLWPEVNDDDWCGEYKAGETG